MHNMYNRQNVIKSNSFYTGSHGRLQSCFIELITLTEREDNTDYVREENILTRHFLDHDRVVSCLQYIS